MCPTKSICESFSDIHFASSTSQGDSVPLWTPKRLRNPSEICKAFSSTWIGRSSPSASPHFRDTLVAVLALIIHQGGKGNKYWKDHIFGSMPHIFDLWHPLCHCYSLKTFLLFWRSWSLAKISILPLMQYFVFFCICAESIDNSVSCHLELLNIGRIEFKCLTFLENVLVSFNS